MSIKLPLFAKKLVLGALTSCLSMTLAFGASQTPSDAQSAGSSLASGLASGSMNSGALLQSGTTTGSSNVFGNSYTGVAPTNLTAKSGSAALSPIGTTQLNDCAAYQNGSDNMANQDCAAVNFLAKRCTPDSTGKLPTGCPQTLSTNDSMLTSNVAAVTQSTFTQTQTQTCRQVVKQIAATTVDERCETSQSPYVSTCSAVNNGYFEGTSYPATAFNYCANINNNSNFQLTPEGTCTQLVSVPPSVTGYSPNPGQYICTSRQCGTVMSCSSTSCNVLWNVGSGYIGTTGRTATYGCAGGYTLINGSCQQTQTEGTSTGYDCPSGGALQADNTCSTIKWVNTNQDNCALQSALSN